MVVTSLQSDNFTGWVEPLSKRFCLCLGLKSFCLRFVSNVGYFVKLIVIVGSMVNRLCVK